MVRHIGTAISYLFIYLFSVQIRNQHLPKPTFKNSPTNPPSIGRSVRISVKAKSITKIWNSPRVFFSYIIYYKILSVCLQRIFRTAKFIFGIIYFKKNIRMTMTILTLQKYYNCSNIPFIMFWTDTARFLQYFRNLSDSFINILAILQDFNEIFSKYCLNITVLCGYLQSH